MPKYDPLEEARQLGAKWADREHAQGGTGKTLSERITGTLIPGIMTGHIRPTAKATRAGIEQAFTVAAMKRLATLRGE